MKIRLKLKENSKELKTFVKKDTIAIASGFSGKSLSSLFDNIGWGNGYVAVPPGHPCYKMNYDTIHNTYDIDVHGGLTFSSMANENKFFPEEVRGMWVVGFDTKHFDSISEVWTEEKVRLETQRLKEQLEKLW